MEEPKSEASTVATRLVRGLTRRPRPLSARQDSPLEGAAQGCPAAEDADARCDVQVGDKRGRSNEVAIGDTSAATSSSVRHIADDPCEGMVAPFCPGHGLIPSRGCAFRWLISDRVLPCAGLRILQKPRWGGGNPQTEGQAVVSMFRGCITASRRAWLPRKHHR